VTTSSTAGSDRQRNANSSDIEKLRNLLLADDRLQLQLRTQELERRVDEAVSKEDFLAALTKDVAVALRRAERDDPKAIARALSPAVVQSIRREIVNSREEMVEALYPITGRMVRAAVRDAVSNLVADINKRFDALTSPNVLKARAKSLFTGRPASSFLIEDTINVLSLERALFIDRVSGALVYGWRFDETAAADLEDTELVSSMFAAISSFAAERLSGPGYELRTLDLNGKQVALRNASKHMLVVEYSGKMTVEASAHLDAAFEEMLDNADNNTTLEAMKPLNWQVADNRGEPAKNLLKPLLIGLATLAIGFTSWSIWDRIWFEQQVQTVSLSVENQTPLHTPAILTDRKSRQITVRGLVPENFDIVPVIENLRTNGIEVIDRTQAVAGALELQGFRTRLDGFVENILKQQAAPAEAINVLQLQIGDLQKLLNTRLSELITVDNVDRKNQEAEVSKIKEEMASLGAALETFNQNLSSLTDLRLGDTRQLDALSKAQIAAKQERLSLYSLAGSLSSQATLIETETAAIQSSIETSSREAIERAIRSVDEVSIVFGSGEMPIDEALAAMQLIKVAVLMELFPLQLSIAGYSDDIGTVEANERISFQRAQWVANQLIELGVPSGRIEIVGLGNAPDTEGAIRRQARLRASRLAP
jgi:outer membrane protein OmpA-like peptidoglycan-associated protein